MWVVEWTEGEHLAAKEVFSHWIGAAARAAALRRDGYFATIRRARWDET